MTWNTSKGFRELTAKEQELFCLVISDALIQQVQEVDVRGGKLDPVSDMEPMVSVPFDGLSTPQKCAVLLEMCRALFEKTGEIPELTAVNESAVYWVFAW